MTPEVQGAGLLLGDTFADEDEQSLTSLFGSAFAQTVLKLPLQQWSGPLDSSYGRHLVLVTAASQPRARPFAEVRERLAGEWRRERQEAAQAQLLETLVRKYRVAADPTVRPFLGRLADRVELLP
jgi:parvulin-like peptidyl-prolyl isomerase